MTRLADPGVTERGATEHGGNARGGTERGGNARGVTGRGGNRARIRVRVFLLTSLALGFYLGFIALTFYRSRH